MLGTPGRLDPYHFPTERLELRPSGLVIAILPGEPSSLTAIVDAGMSRPRSLRSSACATERLQRAPQAKMSGEATPAAEANRTTLAIIRRAPPRRESETYPWSYQRPAAVGAPASIALFCVARFLLQE